MHVCDFRKTTIPKFIRLFRRCIVKYNINSFSVFLFVRNTFKLHSKAYPTLRPLRSIRNLRAHVGFCYEELLK